MKLRIESLELEFDDESMIAKIVEMIEEHKPSTTAVSATRKPREKKAETSAAADTALQTVMSAPVEPEVAAQDTADEQQQARTETVLTLDSVRVAWLRYAQKYGFAVAAIDMQKVIGCRINNLVQGSADDGPAIQRAVDAINAAINGGAPELAQVAPVETVSLDTAIPAKRTTADRNDVMDAFRRYAKKFDGQDEDLSKAVHTREDGARILQMLFGAQCQRIGDIPATPENYARAVNGVDAAIRENPFKRGV